MVAIMSRLSIAFANLGIAATVGRNHAIITADLCAHRYALLCAVVG